MRTGGAGPARTRGSLGAHIRGPGRSRGGAPAPALASFGFGRLCSGGASALAMPQFIYRLQPTRPSMLSAGPTAVEAEAVAEHFAHLQALTQRGSVLLAGRTLTTDDDTFGIVVFEADSEAAARALMGRDPAVARGVMSAELWPFRVALWSAQGPRAEAAG